MDPTQKQFTTSTLVAAAGCEIGTFHKWRARNGLFPETLGASGWNKFSIIDICVVRIIVVLTGHRLSADLAVNVAQRHGAYHITSLFDTRKDRPSKRFLGLYPGDANSNRDAAFVILEDGISLDDAMRKAAGASWGSEANDVFAPMSGVLTVIDLYWILIHVVQRIKMLEPELLPGPFEAMLPFYGCLSTQLSGTKSSVGLPAPSKPKSKKSRARK